MLHKKYQNFLFIGLFNHFGNHFGNLKILTIDELAEMDLCKLSRKFTHNTLPLRINALFESSGHDYDTINKDSPKIKKHSDTVCSTVFM